MIKTLLKFAPKVFASGSAGRGTTSRAATQRRQSGSNSGSAQRNRNAYGTNAGSIRSNRTTNRGTGANNG